MMSWTIAGSNRFFLIFVSFDQAKEKRKKPHPQPFSKGEGRFALSEKNNCFFLSFIHTALYNTIDLKAQKAAPLIQVIIKKRERFSTSSLYESQLGGSLSCSSIFQPFLLLFLAVVYVHKFVLKQK
jgi:hypothetical protein